MSKQLPPDLQVIAMVGVMVCAEAKEKSIVAFCHWLSPPLLNVTLLLLTPAHENTKEEDA
jgi:hypothetical protein